MVANPYTFADWSAVIPLFGVAATAVLVVLADLVQRKPNGWISVLIAALGLLGAGAYAAAHYRTAYDAFGGGFVQGGFAVVFQEIIIIAALFSLALFRAQARPDHTGGAVALLLWATSGAMLMAGAGNLMTVFLGLELLSLALYCLCAVGDRATSRESGLKYLILSSTASGFLLFGMALLFGTSGSIALAGLAHPALTHNALFWLGGGFFLMGLAFKLSLVPFHVWSPDVYEGAPLPITAYMSVATKAGALAVFARFAYAALPPASASPLLMPFFVIAGISMIAGNLGMLAQTDMKRLLAYSGIAQIGYVVAALAGSSALGVRYAIYYLAAYTFMNLGAFAVVALRSSENEEGSRIASFHGLARRSPLSAAAMAFFLLALAGFPPTAGFLGKILILSTNIREGYPWLAGLIVAGTAISLYAYFKIIRLMYDRHAPVPPVVRTQTPLAAAAVAVCLAATLVMTFYPYTPSDVLPLPK
jgi:NADH-quinone oxidoreductase subunit N